MCGAGEMGRQVDSKGVSLEKISHPFLPTTLPRQIGSLKTGLCMLTHAILEAGRGASPKPSVAVRRIDSIRHASIYTDSTTVFQSVKASWFRFIVNKYR